MAGLTDDERRNVYTSLLRGLSDEAQNRLCSGDQGHAWGPWTRHLVQHDGPVAFGPSPIALDRVVRTRAERRCLNCGKEQHG